MCSSLGTVTHVKAAHTLPFFPLPPWGSTPSALPQCCLLGALWLSCLPQSSTASPLVSNLMQTNLLCVLQPLLWVLSTNNSFSLVSDLSVTVCLPRISLCTSAVPLAVSWSAQLGGGERVCGGWGVGEQSLCL